MVQSAGLSNCLAKAMAALPAPSSPLAPALTPSPRRALRQALEEAGKRSFLRLVSHELRTPLNSIIGFSEIISRELYGPVSEPRYREHAELVRDAGLKLLKLVNDVVEIARLESGVVDLDIRPEDPLAVIEEVVRTFGETAAARDLKLIVDALETGPVMADARGLQSALTHLTQNAVDASPWGGKVQLTLRRTGGRITFEVSDEGPGVPVQDISRIMRPFEQGQTALTRSTEGAGLGLPIARGMVIAMGGRLRLISEPGQGLRAVVYLPVADGA